MLENKENRVMEEIGLVTPTPGTLTSIPPHFAVLLLSHQTFLADSRVGCVAFKKLQSFGKLVKKVYYSGRRWQTYNYQIYNILFKFIDIQTT